MTIETGVKALAEAVAVDVKALEDGKVDKVAGKGLSDTNYTQAEKDKLSSLESSKFVGLFVSESALPLTGSDGDYANVDGGIGSDVYRVVWDSSDNKWVRVQGVSTELTDAQIKQQYESNPDTNAFTDDEKSKLTSVANGATANRADSENADKVHTHTAGQVSGLGTAATANLTTSSTDSTAGRVLRVGDFGVGGNNPRANGFDANDLSPGQRRSWSELFTEADAVSVNLPALGGNPTTVRSWHVESMGSESSRVVQYATEIFGQSTVRGRTFVRVRHDSTWHPWQEVIRTGSLLQTTGSSTTFPMSQAATTSALSDKAALRATSTIDGGVRMRLDGTTLYITNDGTNP